MSFGVESVNGQIATPYGTDKITFASDRDGDFEIYVMNTDGTNVTKLTDNVNVTDSMPSLSSEGSKIVFASDRDGDFEICVMNADGTNVTKLTENDFMDVTPFFSPDGGKIAFSSDRDEDFEIYLMNADGTNVVQLTHNEAMDVYSTFPPDGSKIAFSSDVDGDFEIYLMSTDGTSVTQLTENSLPEESPFFSPDGAKVVYVRYVVNYEIYVMNADGSGKRDLTNNTAHDMFCVSTPPEHIEYAPDELLVAFKPNVTRETINSTIEMYHTEVLDYYENIDIYWLGIISNATLEETVILFDENHNVTFAAPIGPCVEEGRQTYPNDPIFIDGHQWNLLNAGQVHAANSSVKDIDVGILLVAFAANERHTDPNGNGAYDLGESIYRDGGPNVGVVDAGDILLAGPAVPAGTRLIAFAGNEMHTDGAFNLGELIYRDNDRTGTVTGGDTRLTGVWSGATQLYSPRSTVIADADAGTSLIAFAANERHAENINANGTYDGGESIYRDGGPNVGVVDAGDILLAGPALAAGTPLIAFAANERHTDPNGNGAYDRGEQIYRESALAPPGTVSGGDKRLLVGPGVIDADIDMPQAWDLPQARDARSVVVAVIDSGVDLNHQDILANLWTNPREKPGDGVDNDVNGYVDDVYGANFASCVRHRENIAVNGSYDTGEFIYEDRDGSRSVTPGDIRLRAVDAFDPGTIVADGDSDLRFPLVDFLPGEKFVDGTILGRYDLGETIYWDGGSKPNEVDETDTWLAGEKKDIGTPLTRFSGRLSDGNVQDNRGHGTHVAGIIGAVGDNNLDIAGICWRASIMTLKATTVNVPGGARDFYEAIDYAIYMKGRQVNPVNIRVISCSLDYRNPAERVSFTRALSRADAKDILFVSSAGNDGVNIDEKDIWGNLRYTHFPCNLPNRPPNVIGVAASTDRDELARFSNWGTTSVDLAAPGQDIVSLRLNASAAPHSGVTVKSGTSMATPHVSGVAALGFVLFPELKDTELKQVILNGGGIHPRHSGSGGLDRMPAFAGKVRTGGRLRWPHTADLGDAPDDSPTNPRFRTLKMSDGALHWDNGNEWFGYDVSSENDAGLTPLPPPAVYDPDLLFNIDPFFDKDAFDDGGFVFEPQPALWRPGMWVTVNYTISSDYFGVNDAAGGRYQAGNLDRWIYVNGYFDWNRNFQFEPLQERAVADFFFPGAPAGFPAPGTFNATIPPTTRSINVSSIFQVPSWFISADGLWYRFRLDYGEDVGFNNPVPLFERDNEKPVNGPWKYSRFGEVEDYPIYIHVFPPESSDTYANKKDSFRKCEPVYACGYYYAPNTTYPIYVVEDKTWTEGMPIPTRLPQTATTITTNSTGAIAYSDLEAPGTPPALIWNSADPGKYDIIVDVNNDGLYNATIDILDDNDVDGAGFVVGYGPTAIFMEEPETPYVHQLVTFNASTSQPGFDGDDECPITEYRWDFGDGNKTATPTPIVYHSYETTGTYYVTLTVYAPGAIPENDTTIHIKKVVGCPYSPIANFTEDPETPYVFKPVYFEASTSKPGFDGDDECPITEYHWNFGDGTSSTGKTVRHIYYKPGNYVVTLTVYAPGISPYIDPQYVGTNTTDTIQYIKQVLPVGGYSIPIHTYTTTTPPTTYFAILTIIVAVFTAIRRKTHRKTR